MKLSIPINREIFPVSLYTLPEAMVGNPFASNVAPVIWFFEFRLAAYSDVKSSSIVFPDKRRITNKLLSEVFFHSKLPEVSELEVKGLRIEFSSSYRERHLLKLTGSGTHSFIEYDPKPFELELYTTPPMLPIIETLVTIATKEPG